MTTKRQKRKSKNSQSSEADYKVGKGRPPKATRWGPGQSGNPKGRPRGAKSVRSVLLEHLSKTVEVHENGKVRRMMVLDAIVLRQVSLALNGNLKAIASILSVNPEFAPPAREEKLSPNATTEELMKVYQSMIRRVG